MGDSEQRVRGLAVDQEPFVPDLGLMTEQIVLLKSGGLAGGRTAG
jgi:hypothetical protein